MKRRPILDDRHRASWESLGGVTLGGITFRNPIATASGTAGHGDELGSYFPLSSLGAMVVKSLYHTAWPGNPEPRVHGTVAGMLNAVGLQGPGVEQWARHDLPLLRSAGATVVASIWGRSVDDYARAAELLRPWANEITAVEVNLSCPNLEGRSGIFAHDETLSREVVSRVASAIAPTGVSVWAKLSANTDRVVTMAGVVRDAGATAVTLINTLLGMRIDTRTASTSLGAGGGGLSGASIHPVAVRAIYDVRTAHPTLDIVGVGGVRTGEDAVEMMMAGATLVQVGTATFADPRASYKILRQAASHAKRLGVSSWSDLVNAAH